MHPVHRLHRYCRVGGRYNESESQGDLILSRASSDPEFKSASAPSTSAKLAASAPATSPAAELSRI